MARRRSHVEQILRQIEELSAVEQCELLEEMLLGQRRSELGWSHFDQLRARLPRRPAGEVTRAVNAAIREIRSERPRTVR